MSRTANRTMSGPGYRITVYKSAEWGWCAECVPYVHEAPCWQCIGFQDLSAALKGAQDHKRSHIVKAVA
jgi:hypothetical protein